MPRRADPSILFVHLWIEFRRALQLKNKRLLILWALLASFFFISGCQTETLPNYPPAYREYAYVTNGKSNDVSVVDLLTFKEIKNIAVGQSPTGIAANAKKNEVYVVNSDSNSLSVIDAERNQVAATIRLHNRPFFVAVTADGKRAVVANAGSANVSVIDLGQRKEIAVIGVGRQPGLARISADGSVAVVSNRADGTVSVLDLEALAVRSTVGVCCARWFCCPGRSRVSSTASCGSGCSTRTTA